MKLETPQIKHIITDISGHYIQSDEPELVINIIEEMISQIRSGGQ